MFVVRLFLTLLHTASRFEWFDHLHISIDQLISVSYGSLECIRA